MKIKRFVGGSLESNGYVISTGKGKDCYIIDPGYEPLKFIRYTQDEGLCVKGVILTHHHHDHVGGAAKIADLTDCPIMMSFEDSLLYKGKVDVYLKDGDIIDLDGRQLKIIATPGHTRGSICIEAPGSSLVFTGDTIFDTDLGRTDLEDGSDSEMAATCINVIDRWPDSYTIYPGHDGSATMRQVRKYNEEFLQCIKDKRTEIKLIALDLDGTTLKKGAVLSEPTRDTLERAIKRGVHVVIATGRVFSALPESIFDIEGLEYVITSNGAHITRLKDMKRIYSDYPSETSMEEVRDVLAARREYPIEVFTDGAAYIDRRVYEDVKENGSDYMDASYIARTRTPVADIYEFLTDNKNQIENINIHFSSFEDKAKLKKVLAKVSGITVTSSMPHNLEIGGRTTSKASAIASLCRLLNIKEKNVMAVGDSPNDEAMIKAAGVGVAMGNAEEEVKACADFITLSNGEDGVAYAVEKFVFGER